MIKRILKLCLASALLLSLSGCGKSTSTVDPTAEYGCDVLNVFNAGEYIGENVIADFEAQYNVRVNYSLFDSNEAMYTKLQGGSKYDVLIPSDYMIERLINEDFLQPLDKDSIPNLANLYSPITNMDYDPGNEYSAPYFWGNVGIVYNKTLVDPAVVEKEGYDIFRNPDYKGQVFMYDSERDAFMIAFKALGYSMNTEDEAEIQAAYEWLLDMDQAVSPAYVTDEIIDGMVNEEKAIGLVYSGDAAYILLENPNMAYYAPETGTNIWVDAMVIPANSECPGLANEFINYILSDDVAYENTIAVGYASTNQSILEEMTADGGEYDGNEAYLPRTDNPKDEWFHYNRVLTQTLSELWIKVKNQ